MTVRVFTDIAVMLLLPILLDLSVKTDQNGIQTVDLSTDHVQNGVIRNAKDLRRIQNASMILINHLLVKSASHGGIIRAIGVLLLG